MKLVFKGGIRKEATSSSILKDEVAMMAIKKKSELKEIGSRKKPDGSYEEDIARYLECLGVMNEQAVIELENSDKFITIGCFFRTSDGSSPLVRVYKNLRQNGNGFGACIFCDAIDNTKSGRRNRHQLTFLELRNICEGSYGSNGPIVRVSHDKNSTHSDSQKKDEKPYQTSEIASNEMPEKPAHRIAHDEKWEAERAKVNADFEALSAKLKAANEEHFEDVEDDGFDDEMDEDFTEEEMEDIIDSIDIDELDEMEQEIKNEVKQNRKTTSSNELDTEAMEALHSRGLSSKDINTMISMGYFRK